MAQQNRTTLQALIDLYITTNGNKEITGAQLNEVLTNLNDSAFLQLDEIRTALSTSYNPATPSDWNVLPTEVKAALDEAISRVEGLENAPNQTAIQTPYTATTPTDWDVVPTELQGSTDELASRMRTLEGSVATNPSQDVVYVSNDGSDVIGEYEIGNPLKPFLTIQAAINAVPTNGIVYILAGTYTETISFNKQGISIVSDKCIINGNITIQGNNILLSLKNSEINGYIYRLTGTGMFLLELTGSVVEHTTAIDTSCLILNSGINKIIGGTFNALGIARPIGVLAGAVENTFHNIKAIGSATGVRECRISDSKVYNSTFTNINTGRPTIETGLGDNFFYNCVIESTAQTALEQSLPASNKDVFYDCRIKGQVNGIFNDGASNYFGNFELHNTTVEGVTGVALNMAQKFDNLYIEGGYLRGATNCINLSNGLNRQAGTNNFIKNCILYAGTGNIINEGSYDPSDAGVFNLQNNTLNKTLTYNAKIIDNGNNTVITGLQEF